MDTFGDNNEVAPHFIKQIAPEFKIFVLKTGLLLTTDHNNFLNLKKIT